MKITGLVLMLMLPVPAFGGIPSQFHFFAHIGDGGGLRTVFLVMNKSQEEAEITIRFRSNNGQPLFLTIEEETTDTFGTTVPAVKR